MFILLLISEDLTAQTLCAGNLGANIFDAGDFGSGQANVLPVDPGIAPGYQYTTRMPPDDGYYTITNNTGGWSAIFPTWLHFRDNSPDPNGYMMVVNASYSPGIFFEQTISGLCENTFYEFSADIINITRSGTSGHILPNVSFLLDNQLQFSTGGIQQSNQWNTYGFTFTTPPGVTEMTLTLRNNAPGGIGNDLALDNISFRACGPSAFVNTDRNIFLCEDENVPAEIRADIDLDNYLIQWQLSTDGGSNWSELAGETGPVVFHDDFSPGTYLYRYLSASSLANLSNFKCRIISDVIRIEVLPLRWTARDTLCVGLQYVFGEDTLSSPGTYTGDFISIRGCDSIVTLELVMVQTGLSFEPVASEPTCPGYSDGSIRLDSFTNTYAPLRFWLNGELRGAGSFSDLPEGSYSIAVEDRFGCRAGSVVDLLVNEPFRVDAGPDLQLRYGEFIESIPFRSNRPAASLHWEPPDFLGCSDCPNPSLTAGRTGWYRASATDERGCPAIDSFFVDVFQEDFRIYIPEAFSPNGDGINDVFDVYTFDHLVKVVERFLVFDRWGGLAFAGSDLDPKAPAHGWDGRTGGDKAGEGVYVYLIRFRLFDGRILTRSGSVLLAR